MESACSRRRKSTGEPKERGGVSAGQSTWLLTEAECPLEAHALDDRWRSLKVSGYDLERAADPNSHIDSELAPIRGKELFLTRHAHSDEQERRSRSGYLSYDFFGLVT